MTAEEAHVRTGLEALNHLCHKKAVKYYDKLKEEHKQWYNEMIIWHKIPTRNKNMLDKTNSKCSERTPMDWACSPVTRPIYTDLS